MKKFVAVLFSAALFCSLAFAQEAAAPATPKKDEAKTAAKAEKKTTKKAAKKAPKAEKKAPKTDEATK